MKGAKVLAFIGGIALLVSGCSSGPASTPMLIQVLAPGNPPTAIQPDANGNYNMPSISAPTVEIKFPGVSTLNVAVDGSVIQEAEDPATQSTLQNNNLGYYSIVNQTVDPTTLIADYQIQVVPPPAKIFGPSYVISFIDVSENSANVGGQLASTPLPVPIVSTATPAPQTAQSAAFTGTCSANPNNFLTYNFANSSSDASAYYSAIDPGNGKTTLTAWRFANGFSVSDNSQDTANATYFNAADLGFGRSMHMTVQPDPISSIVTDYAYYVSNYPTVEDARRGTNLIATVAMEYSPVYNARTSQFGGVPFIKFYVFNNVGDRVAAANLDGCGFKNVPGLCQVCHGGTPWNPSQSPNASSHFLAFDLDNFEYSTASGFTRADQEAAFKQLNLAILNTNPTPAQQDVISGWYGGGYGVVCVQGSCPPYEPLATQNSSYVPAGWNQNSTSQAAYLLGVKPACRSCHMAQDPSMSQSETQPQLDFNTESDFLGFGGLINLVVCNGPVMPQAKVTYLRFWLSDYAIQQLPGIYQPGYLFLPFGGLQNVGGSSCPSY